MYSLVAQHFLNLKFEFQQGENQKLVCSDQQQLDSTRFQKRYRFKI